jgi:hypothetical protein
MIPKQPRCMRARANRRLHFFLLLSQYAILPCAWRNAIMLPYGLTVDNGGNTVFLRVLLLALRLHGFTH